MVSRETLKFYTMGENQHIVPQEISTLYLDIALKSKKCYNVY